MIAADQPTCFGDPFHVVVSSTDDGTILDRSGVILPDEILTRRRAFMKNVGFEYERCVNQIITYDEAQTYDTIVVVGRGDTREYTAGVHADAIIVQEPGVGVFLPVADCVATVAYDQRTKRFAVMHLGRHSTLARLMAKTLIEMRQLGSHMEDIIIWMAPSVQGSHYKLEYFTHEQEDEWNHFFTKTDDGYFIDMQGYNASLAMAQGVATENIYRSSVNTATDDNYFSHSNGDTTGRFAVAAWCV